MAGGKNSVVRRAAIALGLVLAVSSQTARAAEIRRSERELELYLQNALHLTRPLRFQAAEVDLNGDGLNEVIVHITDPSFCGTGGCNTLILERSGSGYRTVTDIAIARPPIRVLASYSHGWRDLGVTVVGGGILTAYEARLRFNGQSYPSNPTVPPAEPLPRAVGEVLIAP